jgi:antitoxin component YwqK of YwqJK toxin-antitoxin module
MKTEKYEVIREYFDNGQLWHEEYWIDGELHNTNGPAYRYWDKNGKLTHDEYWVNGEQLTKEQFKNRKNDCVENKVVEIDGKKYKLVNIDKT